MTDLRSVLERTLFDVRSKIKPQLQSPEDLMTISILDRDKDIPKIIEFLHQILAMHPKSLSLILPHQDFDYVNEEMNPLLHMLDENKNLYFGVFDLQNYEPSTNVMPASLKPYEHQIYGSGTLRSFRQEVVRKVHFVSYLGYQLRPQLLTQLAIQDSTPENRKKLLEVIKEQIAEYRQNPTQPSFLEHRRRELPNVMINYLPLEKIPNIKVNMSEVGVIAPKDILQKTVMVGFSTFRKRDVRFQDGSHVNTPWQGESSPEEAATPLILVKAIILYNLKHSLWLTTAPVFFNIVQVIALGFLSWKLWLFPPALAISLLFFTFLTLLILHGLGMTYLGIYLPLADTVLFATILTFFAAFFCSQRTSRKRTLKQLQYEQHKKLAMLQARFLNKFSHELYRMNEKITATVGSISRAALSSPMQIQLQQKALISCEELQEYLSGIKKFTELNEKSAVRVKKKPIRLVPLLEKIIHQFDSLIAKGNLKVEINCSEDCSINSDEVLLEPIIFNLISNAIKYSPSGKTIRIYVSHRNQKKLTLHVKDEGPGIAPEFQEKIFEKFYRIKNDQVYQIKGNGLGLYLCRFFANKLAISLKLQSAEGQGAQFSLELEK